MLKCPFSPCTIQRDSGTFLYCFLIAYTSKHTCISPVQNLHKLKYLCFQYTLIYVLIYTYIYIHIQLRVYTCICIMYVKVTRRNNAADRPTLLKCHFVSHNLFITNLKAPYNDELILSNVTGILSFGLGLPLHSSISNAEKRLWHCHSHFCHLKWSLRWRCLSFIQ